MDELYKGVEMAKVIVFDLYDTLLKDISFHFEAGLAYLHEQFFYHACTLDELTAYSNSLWSIYLERRKKYMEVCLVRDEIPLLCKKFHVSIPFAPEQLDYELMMKMQQETLLDEVAKTLKALFENGTKLYILSNSIFLGTTNDKQLQQFGIHQYFQRLYCSSDFGWRKPDLGFYNSAITEILRDNDGVTRNDIYYIGNDYETDVKGSLAAGLKTIWYNEHALTNKDKLDIKEVNRFGDLLGIILNGENNA